MWAWHFAVGGAEAPPPTHHGVSRRILCSVFCPHHVDQLLLSPPWLGWGGLSGHLAPVIGHCPETPLGYPPFFPPESWLSLPSSSRSGTMGPHRARVSAPTCIHTDGRPSHISEGPPAPPSTSSPHPGHPRPQLPGCWLRLWAHLPLGQEETLGPLSLTPPGSVPMPACCLCQLLSASVFDSSTHMCPPASELLPPGPLPVT